MNGFISHRIVIFTTPEYLRKMADDMERRIKTITPGQSTFVDVFMIDKTNIEIHLDQEKCIHNRDIITN